jgi:N-acetylated-alpha-linked acidic dipeptidase
MNRTLLLLLLPVALVAQTEIRGFAPSLVPKQRALEERARAVPDRARIREYMQHMSQVPHNAGSPASKAVAEYVLSLLKGWGYDAEIEEYEALLPTPKSRLLEMTAPSYFKAKLQEPQLVPAKSVDQQLPTYNAYAAAGDITAPLVYVNYGIAEDYDYLKKLGIDVKGKIVIARYGGSWRGVKPKLAYEHGAVGCLIYSDPHEDGYFAGDAYPKGPFRPPDGVQRGSVMDMAVYPGDPRSPGWASEKGAKKLPLNKVTTLQKIPVLPISYADAQPLLESLEGPVAPSSWRGALAMTYHIGPGPARVHLEVDFDWPTRPVYDVIAKLRGSEFPSQWVLYGNHHDAWVYGAADPLSGTSALLETARTLGELAKQGWKPKRTVVFGIWDAEEFGLIGSTEWVEKHAADLDKDAVVYFNSDQSTRGKLHVGGSHTLEQFMSEIARDVKDPETGKSLLEEELKDRPRPNRGFRLEPLGSGSDYTPFIHHAGIASVNLGFSDERSGGAYHSIYDSFDWYTRFADPKFAYEQTLTQVMATALLRFADAPLVPFEFRRLSRTLDDYVNEIKKLPGGAKLQLDDLRKEIRLLNLTAASFEAHYRQALERAAASSPKKLAEVNQTLYRSERTMLSAEGLPGRAWFKHQLYAPGLYTGYSAKTLPGIREAAEAGDWKEASRQAQSVAAAVQTLDRQIREAEQSLAGL